MSVRSCGLMGLGWAAAGAAAGAGGGALARGGASFFSTVAMSAVVVVLAGTESDKCEWNEWESAIENKKR